MSIDIIANSDLLKVNSMSGYAIVLDPNIPSSRELPHIGILLDGVVLSPASRLIPADLQQIVRSFYESSLTLTGILRQYFRRKIQLYPVAAKTQHGYVILNWNESQVYQAQLEINATQDQIFLTRQLIDSASNALDGFLRLTDQLVFHQITGELLSVSNTIAWQFWNLAEKNQCVLSDVILVDAYFEPVVLTIQLSHAQFNRLHLGWSEKQSHLMTDIVFKVNQQVSALCNSEVHYQCVVTEIDTGFMFHLQPIVQSIPVSPTEYFFKFLYPESAFSSEIIRNGRKNSILTALFKLMKATSKKEAAQLIKDAISQTDLLALKSELIPFFAWFYQEYQKRFFRVFLIDRIWYSTQSALKREGQYYEDMAQIFGLEVFLGSTNNKNLIVSKEKFFKMADDLSQLLMSHQIPLLVHDKPFRKAQLSVSISLQKTPTQWFELTPHILSNGAVLNLAEIQKIIQSQGFVAHADHVELLDETALYQLTTVAEYFTRKQLDAKVSDAHSIKIPRLAIFELIALQKQGVICQLPLAEQKALDQLRHCKIRAVPIPSTFKGVLREYQMSGFRWLCFLYQHRLGACLADDMGLGKTVQAIAFLSYIYQKNNRQNSKKLITLIVVPPSLIFNWRHELQTFAPHFRLTEYIGNARELQFFNTDIILSTYDIVRRDIDKLSQFSFDVILFDEAQFVKNIYSERSLAARRLQGAFKVCLTGTPIENHLGEYYSILDLALPGLLGNFDAFSERLKTDSSDWILQLSKPFVLRRTKSAILTELPPKIETDKYLELAEDQKLIYQQYVHIAQQHLLDAFDHQPKPDSYMMALTSILRLRQVCISPRLIHPDLPDISPKLDYLVEKLAELATENHSALVFSQFTSVLDLLESRLAKTAIQRIRLDGRTSISKRKELVEIFQNTSTPLVFLMSLKSGGIGLNLTKASYVFHLDPWWNPAVENQATDRAHRIGQNQTVFAVRLLMHHTIEEKMMALKQQKKLLYDAFLKDGVTRSGKKILGKEDFEYLLSQIQ